MYHTGYHLTPVCDNNSSFSHPAKQKQERPTRLIDESVKAAEHRPNRTYEPLRQTKRHSIGERCDFLRCGFERERRVEDSRTIQMNRNRSAACELAHGRYVRKLDRSAGAKVMRIFKRDERGPRKMRIRRTLDFGAQLVEVAFPVLSIVNRRHRDPPQPGSASRPA